MGPCEIKAITYREKSRFDPSCTYVALVTLTYG